MVPGKTDRVYREGEKTYSTEKYSSRADNRKENKRAAGAKGERAAGAFLERQGYEILAYNFRCRMGEIDIVARDGNYLVFVEVKYRKSEKWGSPFEAVDRRKQRIISKVAAYYCYKNGCGETTPCRFDVAAVLGDEIQVIKNAFDYCGR